MKMVDHIFVLHAFTRIAKTKKKKSFIDCFCMASWVMEETIS